MDKFEQHRLGKALAGIPPTSETVQDKYQLCTSRDDLTIQEMYLAGALRMNVKAESVFKLQLALANLSRFLTHYNLIVHDEVTCKEWWQAPYVSKYVEILTDLSCLERGEA